MTHVVRPGDVLVVRDPGFWAWWIRLGARIQGEPNRWNHVVVAHHVDDAGTYWGVEGRPGFVGWRNIDHYLNDPATLTNALQSDRDDAGRQTVCDVMAAMIGRTRYDWTAIISDGLSAVAPLWRERRKEWGNDVPGHVVCSSAADYAYERLGWATPDADQYCTPWDWARLIEEKGWSA